ncbi:hypothetical protein EZV62_022241 [Acer yangbiense]|uniref:Zinc finger PMZ-type domain-containing protein n=1 Tax=Acer yangbiense TaxID=1000413 RepID=A0A5C7H963_9ROSI|nr:hypothetical protein EZV62_022241 [Acer yangbiense]
MCNLFRSRRSFFGILVEERLLREDLKLVEHKFTTSEMDIFTIIVMFGTEVVDVGQCDSDHISLITLTHATIEEFSGKDEVPNEDCLVWIHLPWSGERVKVNIDSELIESFMEFEDRGLEKIVFELKNICYVPSPPEWSFSRPNEEPEVLDKQGGYQALGISFKKMIDGEIKFEVGQTFDNVEQMKEVFKEIYNNKEAKIKWIASKFEDLVKANRSICVNVISDLLRKKYKVAVDMQRLYKAKKRALEGPFIGVDGSHLKGSYGGVLLSTVALDANNGLIPIGCLHLYCARHIYANFRLTYKGDHFKKLFWRASQSSNVFDFKEAMDEIGVINHAAHSWLQEIEPKHWSRASSYLDLLEFIMRMVMRKFQERNEECEQWNSVLPPRCGSWQVRGIPCRHAMAAISHHCGKAVVKDKVSEYVHQSLTKSAYMQTYRGMIHLIPDQKRWPEVHTCILIEGQTEHIDLPPCTVQPGKPKI